MKAKNRATRRTSDPEHIALLDRRQLTWEMPGTPARRRQSRDGGDVHISEHAPANFHVDVVLDESADEAYLWVGIADQLNPPGYNLCYAVIGGDALLEAARRIIGARRTKKGGVR